jgi:hypothetical protein
MTNLKFTVVPYPPYSPDLVPSNFWLFPELKETKGQQISSQPETFFMGGMKKWIEKLKKCVTINGDYVEKKVYNV